MLRTESFWKKDITQIQLRAGNYSTKSVSVKFGAGVMTYMGWIISVLCRRPLPSSKSNQELFIQLRGNGHPEKNGTQQNVGIFKLDVFLSDQIDDK